MNGGPFEGLWDLVVTDPMVPPGYVEMRDQDGRLLKRVEVESATTKEATDAETGQQ